MRITLPDLRGMLGETYAPAASGVLGEHELTSYLAHYIDPEVARVSTEGWGGCTYTLYAGEPGTPGRPGDLPVLVQVSVWDSEDDAVEFFGGLIGALEARYPGQQRRCPRTSTQDQVIWRMRCQRHARQRAEAAWARQVTLHRGRCPSRASMRALAKLEGGVVVDDPAPEMRTREKANLMWNRLAAPLAAGALTPRIALPPEWTPLEQTPDSLAIVAAQRGAARLLLSVDRRASRELGLDGYAHQVAARLQARGHDVYVQTDVRLPAARLQDVPAHLHPDRGHEADGLLHRGRRPGPGGRLLLMWGPTRGRRRSRLEKLFYDLLRAWRFVPESQPQRSVGGRPVIASPSPRPLTRGPAAPAPPRPGGTSAGEASRRASGPCGGPPCAADLGQHVDGFAHVRALVEHHALGAAAHRGVGDLRPATACPVLRATPAPGSPT